MENTKSFAPNRENKYNAYKWEEFYSDLSVFLSFFVSALIMILSKNYAPNIETCRNCCHGCIIEELICRSVIVSMAMTFILSCISLAFFSVLSLLILIKLIFKTAYWRVFQKIADKFD